MKTLSDMYLWTRKSPLNVGSHPDLDPDPGNFLNEFLSLWDLGEIQQLFADNCALPVLLFTTG